MKQNKLDEIFNDWDEEEFEEIDEYTLTGNVVINDSDLSYTWSNSNYTTNTTIADTWTDTQSDYSSGGTYTYGTYNYTISTDNVTSASSTASPTYWA